MEKSKTGDFAKVAAEPTRMNFLPDFLNKPLKSKDPTTPRSTGTMLTYEEVAAKYRRNDPPSNQ